MPGSGWSVSRSSPPGPRWWRSARRPVARCRVRPRATTGSSCWAAAPARPTRRRPGSLTSGRCIGDCLDREVPLLGICLGAQLLGLAAGGRTDRVRGGAEIGVYALWRTDAAAGDPLLGDLPETTRSLQWHSYEVRDLPPGSVALVSSERCANQAFRVGSFAWACQFHLEALAGHAGGLEHRPRRRARGRRPDRRGAGRADGSGRAGAAGDLGAGRRPLAARSSPQPQCETPASTFVTPIP